MGDESREEDAAWVRHVKRKAGGFTAAAIVIIGLLWHPRTLRGSSIESADAGIFESIIGTPGILNLLRISVLIGISYVLGWFVYLLMNRVWPTEISKGGLKFDSKEEEAKILKSMSTLEEDYETLQGVVAALVRELEQTGAAIPQEFSELVEQQVRLDGSASSPAETSG